MSYVTLKNISAYYLGLTLSIPDGKLTRKVSL
jgi:hypothetical protein